MPLYSGDIRIARSAQMNDTPAGGGPPTAQLLPDGASNAIVPDISEDARVGGIVEVRHLHGVLRNTDTAALTGANIVLAEPPADPHVSITLMGTGNTFARRPDIVRLIEATSTPGAQFNGFLLENHVASQRSIQIGQRPGVEPPGVNTTLALALGEGTATERLQYVRVRRVTVTQQIFTEATPGGAYVDYPIQVATCELYSPLGMDFAGSAANRTYAAQAGKTLVRRVNVTDAGNFYSASRLTAPTQAGDIEFKVASIYTQLVPNTRTETPLTDQRPGGLRTVNLKDSVGTLEVSAASHTQRQMITEATQGYAHVFQLKPVPAPGTVSLSYLVMGAWYTLVDDGEGKLVGPGGGAVSYHTGAVSATVQALPDYNSPLIISWADTAPYTNVCANGPVTLTNAIEVPLPVPEGAAASGTTIAWRSGSEDKSATVAADGAISGDATGVMAPAAGLIYLRPAAMPDPGTGFTVTTPARAAVTQNYAGVNVDAGGFASLALDQEPVPGTVRVSWYTAQSVSASSGGSLSGATRLNGALPAAAQDLGPGSDGLSYGVRYMQGSSSYTQTSASSSTTTRVVRHIATDDGAGGFAGLPGSVNYSGRTVNLRLTTQGASASSYQSDYEQAAHFSDAFQSYLKGG